MDEVSLCCCCPLNEAKSARRRRTSRAGLARRVLELSKCLLGLNQGVEPSYSQGAELQPERGQFRPADLACLKHGLCGFLLFEQISAKRLDVSSFLKSHSVTRHGSFDLRHGCSLQA